jgi:hypothetical protein
MTKIFDIYPSFLAFLIPNSGSKFMSELSTRVENMSELSLRLATHESKAKPEIIFYY